MDGSGRLRVQRYCKFFKYVQKKEKNLRLCKKLAGCYPR
jgi:hypothetical protein